MRLTEERTRNAAVVDALVTRRALGRAGRAGTGRVQDQPRGGVIAERGKQRGDGVADPRQQFHRMREHFLGDRHDAVQVGGVAFEQLDQEAAEPLAPRSFLR